MHIFIRTKKPRFYLKFAKRADVPEIMSLVRGLAEYENLLGSVTSTDALLEKSLFDEKVAEVILGYYEGKAVCFALFFRNFSSFSGKPGLYLEDIFVRPDMRGKGFGRIMFAYLAKLSQIRGYAKLEWWCLDWNTPSQAFYKKMGGVPHKELIVFKLSDAEFLSLAEEF